MARSSFAPLPPRLPPLSLALPSPGLPLPLPGPVLTPALPLTPALSKTARMHFSYGVPCTPYGVEPDYVLVHCNFFFVHPEYSYRCMYVCIYICIYIYICTYISATSAWRRIKRCRSSSDSRKWRKEKVRRAWAGVAHLSPFLGFSLCFAALSQDDSMAVT